MTLENEGFSEIPMIPFIIINRRMEYLRCWNLMPIQRAFSTQAIRELTLSGEGEGHLTLSVLGRVRLLSI
jgi:hypothetical protein